MTEPETPSIVPPPPPRFQLSLRTLLLLFVVLGSSLAVFGAWGILVFVLVVGLAVCVREVKSLPRLLFALVLVCFVCLIWLLTPTVESAREAPRRTLCANNLLQIGSAILAYHQANGWQRAIR
jgi:4-amino-4-deoxy-L-arabinose transferase-like glycosyltransferase